MANGGPALHEVVGAEPFQPIFLPNSNNTWSDPGMQNMQNMQNMQSMQNNMQSPSAGMNTAMAPSNMRQPMPLGGQSIQMQMPQQMHAHMLHEHFAPRMREIMSRTSSNFSATFHEEGDTEFRSSQLFGGNEHAFSASFTALRNIGNTFSPQSGKLFGALEEDSFTMPTQDDTRRANMNNNMNHMNMHDSFRMQHHSAHHHDDDEDANEHDEISAALRQEDGESFLRELGLEEAAKRDQETFGAESMLFGALDSGLGF